MDVFVVTAHRFGDTETHNYLVGVFDDEAIAMTAAGEEENWRGGKYECQVIKAPMGAVKGIDELPFQVVKALPSIPTNMRREKPTGVSAYPKHRGENHLRKVLDSYGEGR